MSGAPAQEGRPPRDRDRIYFGGLFRAGGFAFLPGRLMWEVFLG